VLAALVTPATACSLLVDSDIGVRGDGGGSDGSTTGSDGGGSGDAADCPNLPNFPPFADDFADDALVWAIDPKIQRDGPATIEAGVSSGALRFTPGPDGGDNAWVKSVEFDFLEGRVAVRVPTVTVRADTQVYVALLAPSVRHLMEVDGGDLRVPGGTVVPYDSDGHRWWQIRNEDYYLHFETSRDGIAWSELDRIPADIDPTQARIEIGISVASASDAYPGEFAVDDLDLPPCR
jgi:hypothetical protein